MATTSRLDSSGTSWTETKLFDRTFAAVDQPQQPRRVIRGLAIVAGAFIIAAVTVLTFSVLLPSAHG